MASGCPKQRAAAHRRGRPMAVLIKRRAEHAREGDAVAAAALRRLFRPGSC